VETILRDVRRAPRLSRPRRCVASFYSASLQQHQFCGTMQPPCRRYALYTVCHFSHFTFLEKSSLAGAAWPRSQKTSTGWKYNFISFLVMGALSVYVPRREWHGTQSHPHPTPCEFFPWQLEEIIIYKVVQQRCLLLFSSKIGKSKGRKTAGIILPARRSAQRGVCRRAVSVCLSVCHNVRARILCLNGAS